MGAAYVAARTFYECRVRGDPHLRRAVDRALRLENVAYVPLHCRNHWMAGVVTSEGGRITVDVYDSAPSVVVRKEVSPGP